MLHAHMGSNMRPMLSFSEFARQINEAENIFVLIEIFMK